MARRPGARRSGFTLVEAAVAIGVVAVLAGMMAPLAVKVLDQRRTAATRKSLKLAFEGMFGAWDRRVGNMQADFGFQPAIGRYQTLPFLVRPSGPWRDVPDFGGHDGSNFSWGWNGPYWHGDIRNGVPVDAWGSPIELIVSRDGVQVRSRGPRKAEERNLQDLVYPPEPVPLRNLGAVVMVVVSLRDESLRGSIGVRYGGNDRPVMQRLDRFPLDGRQTTSASFIVPAGGLQVEVLPDPDSKRRFNPLVIPMDLLPGETREVRVNL